MTTTPTTSTPISKTSILTVPQPLAKLFSYFPLKTYPPLNPIKVPIINPLLWIHPPAPSVPGKESALSADIECLKWQAHIALRGLQDISVRWDISEEGALGGRLPNLQVPSELARDVDGELLAAHNIPTWIDEKVGELDDLEGFKDVESRDESHAWISLLEGDVHAALVRLLKKNQFPSTHFFITGFGLGVGSTPTFLFYHSVLQMPPSTTQRPIENILTPPPAPLSGFSSILPPYGARLLPSAIASRYRDAIAALSERLGQHEWFLGSSGPTALDAVAFAYFHVLLHAEDDLRIEIARRVNLVHWEHRVRERVRAAFVPYKNAQ
ncbi:hypothetical protein B0F90DRAFT_407905 [Multifurca ochricompacta]|uniref:Metaxin glutathione S-transferase domain-containing protein n=1 Tax=Multifurca ochricompacta TaxID=376703 RepID=A0AAD4LWM6_9AGAM|nr:hypothetical protein B0F90DRAFT_407905 [Multifurca ochricompacta]